MERKRTAIGLLWERSKFKLFIIALLFAIVVYLAYVSFSSSIATEFKVAICGLAVALMTIVGSEFQSVKNDYQIEKILAKLNNVQTTDEPVSSKAEGLILIIKGIDLIYKKDH